jgi:hypothetical protein
MLLTNSLDPVEQKLSALSFCVETDYKMFGGLTKETLDLCEAMQFSLNTLIVLARKLNVFYNKKSA